MDNAFHLAGGLDSGQISRVFDEACQVLEEIGLEIEHPALRQELAGHDGVRLRGDRICYSRPLVESARRQVPREDTNYACTPLGHDAFSMVTPFSCFDVLDVQTGQKRPAAEQDLVDGARLYDALDAIGPVHVHLPLADQRIAQVRMALLCCQNARAIGNWSAAFTYEQAACIRDIYLCAGRPEPYVALQMTHSPLRLDAFFLDILLRLRQSENGLRGITAGGGAMPLPGVSAPLYWPCAAAQGLAECLGAWITAKFIDPAIRPYASFLTWAPDLATGRWTLTTPDALAFALFNQQVMQQILGLSMYADVGDLYWMTLQAMQGTRRFACLGQRHDCFSLPHVAVDAEKISFVQAAVRGMEFPGEPGVTARIIRQTFPQTSFLEHETTLDFRRLHWSGKFFTGFTPARLSELLLADSGELLPAARDIARRKIAENDFQLPADVQRQVVRIYESGIRSIA